VKTAVPDEDHVGKFVWEVWRKPEEQRSSMENYLLSSAKRYMTPRQFDNVIVGYINYWASGGKRLLRYVSPSLMNYLIDVSPVIATPGPVPVKGVWRKSPDLAKDGSNFFDLAERLV
jgi:hypothetical protein